MPNQPANNRLDIMPDGIINLVQIGHQTLSSVTQFRAQIDKLTDDNHAMGKKALVLVDMTAVTGHDPAARDEGRRQLDGNYDALAICGNNTGIRLIVNWLIRAEGKGDRVQFFSTVEEGITWLRAHQ